MNMKRKPNAKEEPTEIQVAVGKANACSPKLVKGQGQLLSVQNGLVGKKLARPIRENVIEILTARRAVCMQLQTACDFAAPEIKELQQLMILAVQLISNTAESIKMVKPHMS